MERCLRRAPRVSEKERRAEREGLGQPKQARLNNPFGIVTHRPSHGFSHLTWAPALPLANGKARLYSIFLISALF